MRENETEHRDASEDMRELCKRVSRASDAARVTSVDLARVSRKLAESGLTVEQFAQSVQRRLEALPSVDDVAQNFRRMRIALEPQTCEEARQQDSNAPAQSSCVQRDAETRSTTHERRPRHEKN